MVDGRCVARGIQWHRLNERRPWRRRLENRDLAKIDLSDVVRTAAGDSLSAAILNVRTHRASMMRMMLCRISVAGRLVVHRAVWRSRTAVRVRSLEAHGNRGDGRDGDLDHHRDDRSRPDQPAPDAHERLVDLNSEPVPADGAYRMPAAARSGASRFSKALTPFVGRCLRHRAVGNNEPPERRGNLLRATHLAATTRRHRHGYLGTRTARRLSRLRARPRAGSAAF